MVALAALGELYSMILQSFSSLNDSTILWHNHGDVDLSSYSGAGSTGLEGFDFFSKP